MPFQGWGQVLAEAQSDGAALNTSTTETSILPTHAKVLISPDIFTYAGAKLRIRAAGRISNIVTTPGTLTFRFKLGATANIAVATTQAFGLNTTAKTNVTWVLEWSLSLRAVGSGTSANFMHIGIWTTESIVGSAAGDPKSLMIPVSAPAVGTGFDSTIANVSDLTAQWSVSNAGNSIQLHQYTLESIN